MKTILSMALLAFSFSSIAGTQVCTFDLKKEGTAVNWTAFKTPKKVGVKGQLTEFDIKTSQKNATIEQLLGSASFTVDSKSVSTGDKARDAKIVQFFFQKAKISGKVLKVNADKVDVELSLNDKKQTVVMTSKFDDQSNTLTLNGTIDVLNFGMKKHLASLTKACAVLHEGVTWPDVNLELVASVAKSCK